MLIIQKNTYLLNKKHFWYEYLHYRHPRFEGLIFSWYSDFYMIINWIFLISWDDVYLGSYSYDYLREFVYQ